MPRIPWLFAAALSLLAAHPALAVRRPHYGGTLRVEMRASVAALDPTSADEAAARLLPLIFDRLVRIDSRGRPAPALALSWTHDAEARRWEFHLRPGVKFHDGAPLAANAAVALSLASTLPGFDITAEADMLVVQSPRPAPDLLLELGLRGYLFTRTADGVPVGTGPFRAVRFEPNRHASFTANDDYWDGRPFLDGVEIDMGRPARDQWIDLEVGKADMIDLAPADVRRARAANRAVWSSAPDTLLAVVFHGRRPEDARLREALALSIDRSAIHNVLLQRRGDIAGGILPQWLSGYEFLFSPARDLARARRLVAQASPAARSFTLGYDPADALAHSIAERIAVNARDAGLSVAAVPGSRADAAMYSLHLAALDPARALADVAAAVGLREWARPDAAQSQFASERALLEEFRVVPLVHLPDDFAAAARVRTWHPPAVTRLGAWNIADFWLDGGQP